MQSLQQLATFVGIGDGTPAKTVVGTNLDRIPVTLSGVGRQLPILTPVQRQSMQAMIAALPTLPPINLQIELVGPTSGQVTFQPVFNVHPSPGDVIATVVDLLDGNGKPVPFPEENVLSINNAPTIGLGNPGAFIYLFSRSGVTSTGFTILQRSFPVTALVKPAPPAPPTPAPVPPVISVKAVGDGSFLVSGSGFTPNVFVSIRIVDTLHPLTNVEESPINIKSSSAGTITNIPTADICAFDTGGGFTFSAQDGRTDGHGGPLNSNFFHITCH